MPKPNDKQFWSFENETEGDVELLIYGVLSDSGWFDDVGSKQFAQDMMAVRGKNVTVRINSVGGDVFTGQAMYSTMKQHDKKVTVRVDGLAASAASLVAMAGDEIIMPSNAMMMIHNPWTIALGESRDFRKAADALDKIRDSIIAAYQEKTSMDREKLVEIMDEESWLTAAECKEYGFADTVDSAMQIAASIGGGQMSINGVSFSLDRFKTLPASLVSAAAGSPPPKPEPGRSAGKPEEKEQQPMNLAQLKAEHPDLYSQVLQEGEQAAQAKVDDAAKAAAEKERERIKSIQDMTSKGHEDLASQAMFDNPMSAEQFAVAVVRAEKDAKETHLKNRQTDAEELDGIESGADDVDGTKNASKGDEAKRQTWRDAAKNAAQPRRSMFSRKEG